MSAAPLARVDLFRIPTRVLFGRGVSRQVAESLRQVRAARVLIVTDPGVVKAGLVGPTLERLREAGIHHELYDGVVPDPTVDDLMDFDRGAAPEKFATIGEAMGAGKDGRAAVRRVHEMLEQTGIPTRLSDCGVTEDKIEPMTKDAMLSGNVLVNPRTTTAQDIEAL